MATKQDTLGHIAKRVNEILLQDIPDEPYPADGNAAWKRLMVGNEHFVSGDMVRYLRNMADEINATARNKLTTGQKPYATIITCSDSRVSPEIIFDEGLGEIFIIRVAGNVVDKIALGSIEYGVEHLHTPLLVVLGHQHCGAVTAAMEPGHFSPGITAILDKIKSAASESLETYSWEKQKEKALDHAIQLNAKETREDILNESKVCKKLVEEGKLIIKCAEYYLDSGKVVDLDEKQEEQTGSGAGTSNNWRRYPITAVKYDGVVHDHPRIQITFDTTGHSIDKTGSDPSKKVLVINRNTNARMFVYGVNHWGWPSGNTIQGFYLWPVDKLEEWTSAKSTEVLNFFAPGTTVEVVEV
eukprot:CAMPEP_0168522706 /NCGR_PEP_ID=MMETSP0405-20121227/9503_1 /TAXON_ID=498012 /ORGANISM="Trichosphaerium sp, Strain Am-I-7 wt" /LENGTH=355 /DNA_ID=CAMNT_0008544351 /DNA_START=26 /DNA_END=1093 /DNA_ORIENTATION=+